MRHFSPATFCLSLTLLSVSLPTHTQPLPISEAITIGSIERHDSALSPDGNWLAYVVRRTQPDTQLVSARAAPSFGLEKGPFANLTLWVVNVLQPRQPRQIGGDTGSSWAPSWSPDGNWLAFYSTEGGLPHVWLWHRKDGTLKMLSPVTRPRYGERVEWTPQARTIVTTVLPEDVTDMVEAFRPRWERAQARQPIVVHRAGIAGSDALAADPLTPRADLVVIDVSSDVVMRRIVRDKAITQYSLSPDGRRVAYVETLGMRPGTYHSVLKLIVQPLAVVEPQLIRPLPGVGWAGWLAWSPSGKFLLTKEANGWFYDGVEGECLVQTLPNSLHDVVRAPQRRGSCAGWMASSDTLLRVGSDALAYVAAADGSVRNVARRPVAPAALVESLSMKPSYDRTVYFLTHRLRDRITTLEAVDLDTGVNARVRTFPAHTHITAAFGPPSAANGCFIYARETVKEPADLWCLAMRGGTLSKEDGSSDRRLTHLNPAVVTQYSMGDSQLVSWRTTDGIPLDGALLLPPAPFRPPYPLVVLVYGRPAPEYSGLVDRFAVDDGSVMHNMQVLATRGYAVLRPDHLPLTRSGRERAGVVMPAILKLIDAGCVDPDRVGVMGHSNGAIEVMQLITESTIFKAAIAQSGAANAVAFSGVLEGPTVEYGQGALKQVKRGRETIAGDLYTMRDKFIEDDSPAFYFDRVETPLLAILGTSDEVVPQFLGDEIFVRLRELNKPVEYVTYRDEGHNYDWWSYSNQVDQWTRVIQWFERYMPATAVALGAHAP